MSARVYILLDVMEGKSDQVARTLRGEPGVTTVDLLEGLPNVIVVLQARGRRKLAELTIRALASVETVTEGLQLLPTRDECNSSVLTKPLL